MCYAIPGKVISIEGENADVEYFGEVKKARADLIMPEIGEYVYAQGGFIVGKIPEKEALVILNEWNDLFFQLKDSDEKQAEVHDIKVSKEFRAIINKAAQTSNLTKEQAIELMKVSDENELKLLSETANQVRHRDLGNACCVHGIIEFSNYCKRNCHYCGLRSENSNLPRYRMEPEEIIAAAEYASTELGFKAFVLQSGEDDYYSDDMLAEIVSEIWKKCNALIFVSFGDRSASAYKKFYNAGARACLMRFETSNKELYEKLHPGDTLEKKIGLIKEIADMGYLIATGGLIGLPGQTEEDLINDIILTKELGTEMYSFGPFMPHPDTPLADADKPSLELSLKTLSVARLLDPESKILVTTALETLNKKGKEDGLRCGGNSLMVNVTPKKYKELYSIYPNKAGIGSEMADNVDETVSLLKSLGRAPTDLGF
ncbi:[FeFe] hydrogenase H-cluster radical SAM maturase HydE [Candidatus Undinarchaeota archaeon]